MRPLVTAVILARLEPPRRRRPPARPAPAGGDPAALHAEADALRQRLQGLADAYADGAIDRPQLASGQPPPPGPPRPRSSGSSPPAAARGPPSPASPTHPTRPPSGRGSPSTAAGPWSTSWSTSTILPARKGRRPGWQAGESYFDPASVRVTPKEAGE